MQSYYQQKFSRLMQKELEQKHFAGASICILKNSQEVFRQNYGMANLEAKTPLQNDTIFRLYSFSKPVAAVAAMILWERGELDLKAPVSEFFPSFRNQMVWTPEGLVKAKREIILTDLLNMTSGLVYPDPDPCGLLMGELFHRVESGMERGEKISTEQLCSMIGEQPLAFHPGERWRYGTSVDVMGGVIEQVSGVSLGEFYQKEIFEPLEMADTGFFVPEKKQHRLAELYRKTETDAGFQLEIETKRHLCLTRCLEAPSFESAGAGLLSTMDDCKNFVCMLANHGEWNHRQILGRKTMEWMVRNQLTEQQKKTVDFEQLTGYGYGSFMRVMEDSFAAGDPSSLGSFGWDGWSGPYFSIDPQENLIFLFMTQIAEYSNWPLLRKMHAVTYRGLE